MPGARSEPSPLRAPLLAGVGAAAVLVLGVAGLSFLSGGERPTISASVDLPEPAPLQIANAAAPDPFAPEAADEINLPGVRDTAEALTSPPPAAPATPRRAGPRAPLPGLYENGPGGPLPIIAADGRRPDQAYATPFDGSLTAPTIAVVVGGLGLSDSLTERAIETLPASVTLSFAPYADNLQDWIDRARTDGHEVLLELPMEPFDYPNNDPGPHTLLVDASAVENTRRLTWLLSRAAGYAGVANYLGARLGASEGPMANILSQLEARGLSVFHDGAGRRPVLTAAAERSGARLALADRVIDGDPTPEMIDARLFELEALALQNGTALGSGFAYPATLDTIAAWAEGLENRGYQLAPASFLMQIRSPVGAQASAGDDDGHGNGHGDTH